MATTASISDLMFMDPSVYRATASVKDGSVDIASTTVTGNRSTGLFAADNGEMGKDDFLLLLVTQLRMQDPLSPMDNTDFMTQVAQLRSLESSNNMQKAIEGLQKSYQSTVDAQKYGAQAITNAAAVSLIGKQVRLKQTEISSYLKMGETLPITVHLGNASSAEVRLLDSEGKLVKTFQASGKDAENSVRLVWDGVGDDGKRVKNGTYTIEIAGAEANPALYAFVQDVVYGVRFGSDGALIKVGGRELPIENVMDVSMGNGAAELNNLSPASAVALLGKEVRCRQSLIGFRNRDGETVSFNVSLGTLSSVNVKIVDSSGQVVRTVQAQGRNGTARVAWDGRLQDGSSFAKPGAYRIEIDEAKANPSVYAYVEGVVDGVTSVNGITQIRINGALLPLSDIIDIAPASDDVQEDTV